MTGGTISNNVVGVESRGGPFTMTGGVIKDNTAPIGGGIHFRSDYFINGAFYVSGNVTIANNGVGLEGSVDSPELNTIIYIGDNFNPVGTIAVDVYSYDETAFNGTWGSADGHVFLKGGTTENPTAVTAAQAAKFTPGKAGVYGDSYDSPTEEKTGGALTITGLNSDNFGVAKWTAVE
jgi:hypothetical protein